MSQKPSESGKAQVGEKFCRKFQNYETDQKYFFIYVNNNNNNKNIKSGIEPVTEAQVT